MELYKPLNSNGTFESSEGRISQTICNDPPEGSPLGWVITNLHWYKLIRKLPQEIQDLIGEFNSEHREQMHIIQKEFMGIIYKPCKICSRPYPKEIFYSVDYFINHKYDLKYYWCSDYCFDKDKEDETKYKYLTSVKDYLLNYSITHKGEEFIF